MKVFSSIAVQPAVEVLLPDFIKAPAPPVHLEHRAGADQAPAGGRDGRSADPEPCRHGRHAARRPHPRGLRSDARQLARRACGQGRRAASRHLDRRSAEARAAGGAGDLLHRSEAGGASGIHFAKVIERMGIAEESMPRTPSRRPAASAAILADRRGRDRDPADPRAEAGRRTSIVGPLPAPYDLVTVFVAGIEKASGKAKEAKTFVDFLRTPAAQGFPREGPRSGLN